MARPGILLHPARGIDHGLGRVDQVGIARLQVGRHAAHDTVHRRREGVLGEAVHTHQLGRVVDGHIGEVVGRAQGGVVIRRITVAPGEEELRPGRLALPAGLAAAVVVGSRIAVAATGQSPILETALDLETPHIGAAVLERSVVGIGHRQERLRQEVLADAVPPGRRKIARDPGRALGQAQGEPQGARHAAREEPLLRVADEGVTRDRARPGTAVDLGALVGLPDQAAVGAVQAAGLRGRRQPRRRTQIQARPTQVEARPLAGPRSAPPL